MVLRVTKVEKFLGKVKTVVLFYCCNSQRLIKALVRKVSN